MATGSTGRAGQVTRRRQVLPGRVPVIANETALKLARDL
jgi:hypothetical protein